MSGTKLDVDETHENAAEAYAVWSFIKVVVFEMHHCHFQGALADVMPTPGLCRVCGEWSGWAFAPNSEETYRPKIDGSATRSSN